MHFHPSELVVGLLAVTTALAVLARRMTTPFPILLVLCGTVLGLMAYRVGVTAATTGLFSLGAASVDFVKVGAGGLLLGLAAGWLVVKGHGWLNERGWVLEHRLLITLTLLTPFAVYLPAEHLGV